ncbi:MAG: DUF3842 family protein [Chloroflexota bacterium]|nr:DUF3842 family protein [Chloroflexota bacterium]
MVTVRRVYVFLVCAISLQALTWASIALARDLLPFGAQVPVTAIAFEIAVIVVGLPFFLVHWLWAQRLAARDEDERGDVLRRVYLYGMLAIFLFAFASQVLDLLTALLRLGLGVPRVSASTFYSPPPLAKSIADAMVGIVVLALVWLYHQWIVFKDARAVPETGSSAAVHRLYILGFSTVGLTMFAFSVIQLLRWVLFQFGTRLAVGGSDTITVADEIARLLVGLSLWLVPWLQAQISFKGPSAEERESALRKFYLYLVVLVAVLSTVTSATFILAEFLRVGLGLPTGGDLRNPISIMIVMVAMWAYHYMVLRGDTALIAQVPRQLGVRRLYLYLVAGVGLAAFLGGLIGVGQVLIQTLVAQSFGAGLKEQLAWSTAGLIAGLPVWLLPWRRLQNDAVAAGAAGGAERQSLVRKISLYFYLFVASITVLFSAIYILFRLLSLALGERNVGNLLMDLANAIGFSLIAVGVWVYHGIALRGDGKIGQREKVERLGSLSVAVVDGNEGRWGRATLNALKREWPGLKLQPIGLTPAAAKAMEATADQNGILAQLGSAGLIVGPWTIAAAGSPASPEIARAISASPARKLLIPFSAAGWDWVGVERLNEDAFARQAARAVKQVLEGDEIKPARSPILTVILAIIGACVSLMILSMLLSFASTLFLSR